MFMQDKDTVIGKEAPAGAVYAGSTEVKPAPAALSADVNGTNGHAQKFPTAARQIAVKPAEFAVYLGFEQQGPGLGARGLPVVVAEAEARKNATVIRIENAEGVAALCVVTKLDDTRCLLQAGIRQTSPDILHRIADAIAEKHPGITTVQTSHVQYGIGEEAVVGGLFKDRGATALGACFYGVVIEVPVASLKRGAPRMNGAAVPTCDNV